MTSPLLDSWTTPAARDRLAALAEGAGVEIMLRYNGEEFEVSRKDDGSPITEADHASHHAIVDGLQGMSDLPIISEESKAPPYTQRKAWTSLWCVDPMDGTKEFLKDDGEFTVNIGLIEQGRPVVGVVHAPALDVTYWGCRGVGAWRRERNNEWERIETREVPTRHPLKVVVSRSHPSPELEAYLARLGDHEVVARGSSLKLCTIAEGHADLYPRLGTTMEWDTAAGEAILEAAGGVVRDMGGRPLAYNKEDLLNPHFVAAGDASWFA